MCLLLICYSCVRSKQSNHGNSIQLDVFIEDSVTYYPIKGDRITVDLDSPQKASLFDYFKHIELIPLETNDDVLIGNMTKIVYHQSNFYTLDRKQLIIQVFDKEGKFISKLGKRGQGPGEYIRVDDIIVNPFTGNIDFLNTFGLIHSYDLIGNQIKTIRVTNNELRAIHYFVALNENTYVINAVTYPFKVIYFDVDEMKMLHQDYEENELLSFFHTMYPFYEYHGKWYFFSSVANGTYELGSESLVNAYVWDFGKYNYNADNILISETMRNDYDKMMEEYRRLPYMINIQGQNNRYVMAQIILKNVVYANLMFDKSTQECKFIKHFDESVEFQPLQVTNEYVLSYCIHDELEKYINKEMLDEINRQKFEALMNAKEEENPIIIKYYFK